MAVVGYRKSEKFPDDWKLPTHIDATHAISKFDQKFRKRILTVLDQNPLYK